MNDSNIIMEQQLSSILIDNESDNLNLLNEYIETYCFDYTKVIGTSTKFEDAVRLINQKKPDLLFLDIELDQGTGFDLLLKIDPYDYVVIFVSAYDGYILESFKYNTASFLIKPINIEDLKFACSKVFKQIKAKRFTNLEQIKSLIGSINVNDHSREGVIGIMTIPGVYSTKFIRTETIEYCRADGRYTEFYLTDGTTLVSCKNIGDYEKLLPSNVFFRIHKTYIINLNVIIEITKKNGYACELKNGQSLPISKRKYLELVKFLNMSV